MAQNHRISQVWQARPIANFRHSFSPRRWFRYATARGRRAPRLHYRRCPKAGTTSLWGYLAEHPHVDPPMAKEISFFDRNFHRGMDWYRMYFPFGGGRACSTSAPKSLSGESTAHYMFHPLAAERIAASLPQVKVIMLLRNPVDRA